jgi:hypothetical protein
MPHTSFRALPIRLAALGVSIAATLTVGICSAAQADAASSGGRGPAARTDATAVSSTATLSPEAAAAGRAAHGAKATHLQSLEAYWTPERMRAAIPADRDPAVQASAAKFATTERQAAQQGKKLPTNDGPVRTAEGAASKVFTAQAGGITAAYNPNLPYYTPTAYTAGKVFFTKGGLNYVCSGTIVNSEGKDTVWSAGHCVHGGQGGTWHTNWSFVPAYDDDLANPRPYGTWYSAQLWTMTGWINSSDFSQDFGVSIMQTRNGWHIVDYFGGQGLTVNRGKNVFENSFGYPAEWPYDGGNLMRCWGTTSPEWDVWFTWSQTVKISCDMTRGSSGGGWLYGYDGNWGYLNGVNSRIDRIVAPTIMLSPYFDDDAWSLHNATRYL